MYLFCYKTFTPDWLQFYVWWQSQIQQYKYRDLNKCDLIFSIWVGSWNGNKSEMFLWSGTDWDKENWLWKNGCFFWQYCCIYCWPFCCRNLPLYNRSFLWHNHYLSWFSRFCRKQATCRRVMKCCQLVMFEAMNGGVMVRSKGVCMQKLLDLHSGIACWVHRLDLSWMEKILNSSDLCFGLIWV